MASEAEQRVIMGTLTLMVPAATTARFSIGMSCCDARQSPGSRRPSPRLSGDRARGALIRAQGGRSAAAAASNARAAGRRRGEQACARRPPGCPGAVCDLRRCPMSGCRRGARPGPVVSRASAFAGSWGGPRGKKRENRGPRACQWARGRPGGTGVCPSRGAARPASLPPPRRAHNEHRPSRILGYSWY